MRSGVLRVLSLCVLALVLLFVDFSTKAICYHLLPLSAVGYKGISLFQNFLGIDASIHLLLNRGAAWGLFANFQIPLLILRIIVILCMLGYLCFKKHRPIVDWPMMLICTGAIGNVSDYFLYGSVVDFLHFNLWGYHFPLFNVADTLICIGVGWLLILSLCHKKSADSCHERR